MSNKVNDSKVKLIILALLKRLPGITPSRLQNLAQETLFFDYFTVAEAISLLCEQKLITVVEAKYEIRKDVKGKPLQSSYLTEKGELVYEQLKDQVPAGVQEQIMLLGKEENNKADLEAFYLANADNSYTLHMRAKDKGRPLLEIRLHLPEENRARSFANRWQDRAGNIYSYLLTELNREEKEDN